jgi:hypothetical protein
MFNQVHAYLQASELEPFFALSWIITWSCLVLHCLAWSFLVLSCRVVSCRVVSCRVLSCLVFSRLVVLSCLVSSRLVSCLVLSCLDLRLDLSCIDLSFFCLVRFSHSVTRPEAIARVRVFALPCLIVSCLILSRLVWSLSGLRCLSFVPPPGTRV